MIVVSNMLINWQDVNIRVNQAKSEEILKLFDEPSMRITSMASIKYVNKYYLKLDF